MRERLTLAMIGMALAVMSVIGVSRFYAVTEMVHTAETEALDAHAAQVATALDNLYSSGTDVERTQVWALTGPQMQLTVSHPGEPTVVVAGSGFTMDDSAEPLSSTQTVGSTTVSAVESGRRAQLLASQALSSLLILLLVLVVLAGVASIVIAARLTRPISRLAESADALSRGRYDVDLPTSRMREVNAISAALQASADRVREAMQGGRRGLQDTSHALRTPLTGARLEFEEVLSTEELDPEVRGSIERGLADLARLQDTLGEVLDNQRRAPVVPHSEISLIELGQYAATRWRDRLPGSRDVQTFVDAGEDLDVTPGPLEQVLDSILNDVRECGTGGVTLRLEADENVLRVCVRGDREKPGSPDRLAVAAGRDTVEALGGRWVGDALHGGLEVLLPRR